MIEIFFAFIILFVAIFIFIHISRKLRSGRGSLTTTTLGATDLFYDKKKKKAIARIAEIKADKKQKEQSSEDSEDKKKATKDKPNMLRFGSK